MEERRKTRGMQAAPSFAVKGVKNGNSGQLALGSWTECVGSLLQLSRGKEEEEEVEAMEEEEEDEQEEACSCQLGRNGTYT